MRFSGLCGFILALGLASGCDEYGKQCADLDGDGVFANCKVYDETHPGPDCNDDPADPLAADNWVSCDTCVDADGDGHFVACDAFTVTLGPDCDDTPGDVFASNNWASCDTCADLDGDGAFGGCDAYLPEQGLTEDPDDGAYDLLIVVDARVADSLSESLAQYRRDLQERGIFTVEKTWSQGGAEALREVLKEAHETYDIEGAFLVGDLPAAWYEGNFFGDFEQFPTDIFLQDFNRQWRDHNGNGVYDGYSDVVPVFGLEIYLSRVTGSVDELTHYFDKVHRYRTEGPLVDPSMFVFIDDDWLGYGFEQSTWGLSSIYDTFVRMESTASTTRDNYVQQMRNGGAEYVYQWIHSSATTLYFEGYNAYNRLHIDEINRMGVTGSFYNLFDCSASRYTEDNLAETYLHQEHGLATIGSTKPGGIYEPQTLHEVLANGGNWGQGYKNWYERVGIRDDGWFLGIVIMGDPTLTLSDDTRRSMNAMDSFPTLTAEQVDAMEQTLTRFASEVGTYEQYRSAHPQFD